MVVLTDRVIFQTPTQSVFSFTFSNSLNFFVLNYGQGYK